MTASKSSSLIFHNTRSRSSPALVTITSSRPNSPTARSTSASAAARVADRAHLRDGPAALARDRRDRLLRGVGVDVVDHHRGAGARERDRVGAAEAAPAPGHHRHPVVEPDHA